MLKKYISLLFFSAAMLAGWFWLGLARIETAFVAPDFQTASIFAPKEAVFGLSEEELADFVRPSVVRIVQHVKGEVSIPAFDLDLRNLDVFLAPKRPATKIPINEYLTGSGFIINSDGYIFTNAHVISEEIVKISISSQVAGLKMIQSALAFPKEKESEISADQNAMTEFAKRIVKFVKEKSTFKLERAITVVNPTSTKEKLEDLLSESFPAKTVKVNDQFADDDRDAGLIKIEQKNLPALSLGESKSLTAGRRIYVFGFPKSAKIDEKDFLEPTFTQGVISAVKDSQKNDFKLLQTDAKISQGSSGGPLFNEKGEVLGLITFQTSALERQNGDNFASAIPIEIAKSVALSAASLNKLGNYGEHFLAGLNLMKNKRCAKALEEFALAGDSNKMFAVEEHLNRYIAKCNDMIASGQSVDTVMDEAYEWMKSVGLTVWAMIGGSIVLVIVLIFVVIRLMRRMRKEEVELRELEDKLETNGNRAPAQQPAAATGIKNVQTQPTEAKPVQIQQEAANPVQTQILKKESNPVPVSINPDLLQYIIAARKAGMSDPIISAELRKAGWAEGDISAALQKS